MCIVSYIIPDYFLPYPEFDNLEFRQCNEIFTMRAFQKKVIYVLYIIINWTKYLVQKNLNNYKFCVLSCFCKIEVGGSSLKHYFFVEIILKTFISQPEWESHLIWFVQLTPIWFYVVCFHISFSLNKP